MKNLIIILILVLVLLACESESPVKSDEEINSEPLAQEVEDVSEEEVIKQPDQIPSQQEEVAAEDDPSVDEEVEVPTELKLNVGETAKTSTLQVTVLSVENTKSYGYTLGTSALSQIAKTGNTFLIFDIEIENIGADSVGAGYLDFSMSDSEGYRYEFDIYWKDDKLEYMQLYLNQKMKGKVLFEVPKTAEGLKLHYDFGNLFTGTKLATWTMP